ncbi:hypothetical protein K6U51_05880 [Vibrio fluvialis]|uniref:hypothetical protein n=1 Tax=Vibrio fluvialis TaxID=676 RepID=UPI001EEC2F72|nr:hypothetical protein [Vibrio fluvialis]MCG6389652.1 hypothetical protein [Vibrio fluvialis]MCG6417567.1 hypothetical protein [Vibrio fluvialis]
MDMATPEQIAELRFMISPFNSSVAAVSLERIEQTYDLFFGQDRGIVHPRLIFEYLTENKPMPKAGYESVKKLLSVS